jgi:hypothetical protein
METVAIERIILMLQLAAIGSPLCACSLALVVADPQIAEHSFDCHFPLQPEFPRNGEVSPENNFPVCRFETL